MPLDRIQDVEVVHPGRGCVDERYGLMTLKVQTAGSSGAAEIAVAGLKDVNGFKARVLAQKEANEHGGVAPCYAEAATSLGVAAGAGAGVPAYSKGEAAAAPGAPSMAMPMDGEARSAAQSILASLRRLEAMLEPSQRYHKLKLQQEGMM